MKKLNNPLIRPAFSTYSTILPSAGQLLSRTLAKMSKNTNLYSNKSSPGCKNNIAWMWYTRRLWRKWLNKIKMGLQELIYFGTPSASIEYFSSKLCAFSPTSGKQSPSPLSSCRCKKISTYLSWKQSVLNPSSCKFTSNSPLTPNKTTSTLTR